MTAARPVDVLVIPTEDGQPWTRHPVDDPVRYAVEHLGGQVTAASVPGGYLLVRDDARAAGLPVNLAASRLMEALQPGFAEHDLVFGPAVAVGVSDAGEYCAPSPDVQRHADRVDRLHRLTRA